MPCQALTRERVIRSCWQVPPATPSCYKRFRWCAVYQGRWTLRVSTRNPDLTLARKAATQKTRMLIRTLEQHSWLACAGSVKLMMMIP